VSTAGVPNDLQFRPSPSFLRKLSVSGLRGVKLVISDAHEVITNRDREVLSAAWRRCGPHVVRNALGHAGRSDTSSRPFRHVD
jgi:transposase-like protein